MNNQPEKSVEEIAEEIIQDHRIPDVADSSVLYFEPDRDEIKQDIVDALQAERQRCDEMVEHLFNVHHCNCDLTPLTNDKE